MPAEGQNLRLTWPMRTCGPFPSDGHGRQKGTGKGAHGESARGVGGHHFRLARRAATASFLAAALAFFCCFGVTARSRIQAYQQTSLQIKHTYGIAYKHEKIRNIYEKIPYFLLL